MRDFVRAYALARDVSPGYVAQLGYCVDRFSQFLKRSATIASHVRRALQSRANLRQRTTVASPLATLTGGKQPADNPFLPKGPNRRMADAL